MLQASDTAPRDTGYQKGAGTLECSPMRYGRHCRNCSFGRWTWSPSEHHCGAAGSLDGGSLVVMHSGPYPSILPDLLGRAGVLPAAFARDGDKIEVGHIYVAPPDHHMVLGFDSIRLNQGPKVHYTRPAADPLFISAAEAHGKRVMGVVLSGGNSDGAAGLRAIAEHGGTALVQDPKKKRQCLTCRARRLRRIIPMLA